jgi:pyrroline-5-carboxylate reductase
MKLGFIGCGKMATALVHGVQKTGLCAAADIFLSDAIPAAAEKLAADTGATKVDSNAEVIAAADVVVLAVKPSDALAAIKGVSSGQMENTMRWAWKTGGAADQSKLLLSIVAGLSLSALEAAAGDRWRVVRVMPNTPALLLQGASAFAPGSRATTGDAETAQKIFGSVGLAVQVKEELLDAVTGLSGSGPAYVYTVVEALADGGVLMGLPRDLALRLAAQTVAGAAQMVLDGGEHPGVLRDRVASPGGTTIAGLEALEKGGLRSALITAVRAATERSRQLGGK